MGLLGRSLSGKLNGAASIRPCPACIGIVIGNPDCGVDRGKDPVSAGGVEHRLEIVMKRVKAFLVLAFLAGFGLAAQPAWAEQKYNPYTGKWETVRPGAELKYNPHSGSWGYAAPEASPKYNPHSSNWEMAPPIHTQKYNPHSGQWETASPKSSLEYNPHSGDWQYVAPGSKLEYNPHAGEWEYPK
jgi:hypothetical protein